MSEMLAEMEKGLNLDTIQQFYTDNEVVIHSSQNGEFVVDCPSCRKKRHFYIKKESGQYLCQHCNIKGNANIFLRDMKGVTDKRKVREILEKYRLNNGQYGQGQNGSAVKVYDYVDLNDKLVHQTVRYEPKRFSQRRPNENGRYIWNLKGVETILYRLSEIVGAETVVIAEGEKDCDNVVKHFGFQTTTCPMGAGKWKDNYNEYLKGKGVIVLWDRDQDGKGYKHAVSIANSLFGMAKNVKIIDLPETLNNKKIKDVSDYIEAGGTKEDFLRLVDGTKEIIEKIETSASKDGGEEQKPTQAEHLIKLANRFELFHDQNGDAFVFYNREVLPLRSRKIKELLSYIMYKSLGKSPNSDALEQALKTLNGKAIYECRQYTLHNRVAKNDGTFFYDLGEGKVVEITNAGWNIIDAPILFRRYAHQQPQATPKSNGNVWDIFDFLNVEKDHKLLVLVSIISCLIPDMPHPILHPHGAQGSGKTTLFKVIKKLIDPSMVDALITPRNATQLVQVVTHHHVCLFDNMSELPDWMSDILAIACTGGGFSKRQLFTDDDDIIYQVKGCIGINGINLLISRPDLMDRSILLCLERISQAQRKIEKNLWEQFERKRPGILGGMFDVISKAMGIYSYIKLETLPRMADFVTWGCAITEALGRNKKEFLEAYQRNISRQNDEVIQNSTLAQAVLTLIRNSGTWRGAVKEAWQALKDIAEPQKEDTTFPKTERSLRKYLERIKTNLIDEGIRFQIGQKSEKGILIVFQQDRKFISLSSGCLGNSYNINCYNDLRSEDKNLSSGNKELCSGLSS